jgi:nitrous oxide reductase accessory protein NosL
VLSGAGISPSLGYKINISGEWIEAQKGFYVFDSKAIPACSPSWIAFEKKSKAEMFQKEFGGTVYSYEDALKKRASMPKEMSSGK